MHRHVLRLGRRIGIAIGGGVVVLAGVAMLVAPGPGLVTIALGLAILSLEFERPRVWLAHMKAKGGELKPRIARKQSRSGDDT
jgi:UPF0716 family protein affecting phage T7 exclusion